MKNYVYHMYLREQLDNCLQEIINLSAENEKLKREIARYKTKEDALHDAKMLKNERDTYRQLLLDIDDAIDVYVR